MKHRFSTGRRIRTAMAVLTALVLAVAGLVTGTAASASAAAPRRRRRAYRASRALPG